MMLALIDRVMKASLALTLLSFHIAASAQPSGPVYSINVRGIQMNCTSYASEPVELYFDQSLANVGIATRRYGGRPIIVFNPNVTRQFSDLVTQWWFAHECAHHALPPNLNNESNADCFAIRQMRQYGFLRNPNQLATFYYELGNLPGSAASGHLPGPQRAQNIANCALY